MIETTEPMEASLTKRIEALGKVYQERMESRQRALQQAQRDAEDMLRAEGAWTELQRLKDEIWKPTQGETDAAH